MIQKRPSQPQRQSEGEATKPYSSVSLPNQPPRLERPAGQDRFRPDRFHGKLFLSFAVKTPLHISTGIVVPGVDVGLRVSLVKTMASDRQGRLLIPGSSLKGVVRSMYEAITNSTFAVVTPRYRSQMPKNRLPCSNKEALCPASRVFGALNWQGLVRFTDAVCDGKSAQGFIPSLHAPRPQRYLLGAGRVGGRKFYYQTRRAASADQNRGIAVQWVAEGNHFSTCLTFSNLTEAELGTLLIVLGQDPKYGMSLKIGGGKPVGMGTVTTTVMKIEYLQNLKDRYRSLSEPGTTLLEGKPLSDFINKAIQKAYSERYVLEDQLRQLAVILAYPTDREPPSGMY
jgi:hypothetical protein